MKSIGVLLTFVSFLAAEAVDVRINPSKIVAEVPRTLYGIGMEDVNHEIYGGLDRQLLFGESFEEPTRWGRANGASGQWTVAETSRGGQIYWQTNTFHYGHASQELAARGGVSAIANMGLNGWGIPVRKNARLTGYVWVRSQVESLTVGLSDRDGERTYASALLTPEGNPNTFRKCSFSLTPTGEDSKGRFFIRAEGKGTVFVDDAYLAYEPTNAFGRIGCREDIVAAFQKMGVGFVRWGGTMANAGGYRLKNMPGTGERIPYEGFWYKKASGGFGIREFVRMAAEMKVPCAFSMSIDETVDDAAAFARELKAYDNINIYVQIGNEECPPWLGQKTDACYEDYGRRVRRLVPPMRAANPKLKFVSAAYWHDDAPEMMKLCFDLTDGIVDHWDIHVDTTTIAKSRASGQMLDRVVERFHLWNPKTTMTPVVFECNSHHCRHERALAHAVMMGEARRFGKSLVTCCPVNALQPLYQNDNGWDQGLIFFTPDTVWFQSYGWAHKMAADNHRELLVESVCDDGELYVSATRNRAGNSFVLHVVNGSGTEKSLTLKGLEGRTVQKVTTLAAADLNADNPFVNREHIVPVDVTDDFRSQPMVRAFSYTVIEF